MCALCRTKQSEDPEEEGQGICGTAGACLELVTRTVPLTFSNAATAQCRALRHRRGSAA